MFSVNNINVMGNSGVFYPQAVALFAAMTTPPTYQRRILINNTIGTLLSSGAWQRMDRFYVLAGADSQASLLNWLNPGTDTLAAVNSPTFTADRGYTGDGSASYLAATYNPVVGTNSFTLNSAHMACWIGTNVTAANQMDAGNITARMDTRNNTASSLRLNNPASDQVGQDPVITSNGYLLMTRSSSASYDVTRSQTALISSATATASLAMTNLPFYILASSNTGPVPVLFSTRRVQAVHWGTALNQYQINTCYAALVYYMQGVGAVG